MKIKIQELYKSFDSNTLVLENLNFQDEIHSLAIIGPSGGGKSTFLRILGGLLEPTKGKIWINHKEILFQEEELQEYRKTIGFVFQQNGLLNHMTSLENIAHPLREVHGYSKKEADKIATDLLIRFGLEEAIHKKPSALSGGQKQRVGIARAIAPKPQFLLFDEPTSALDPEYTIEVLNIINELKEEGIDFIIVTHEMGFARHACDKVAFLAENKLLEYGNSSEVFSNPKNEKLKTFLDKLLEWNV